jgi:hypothetical protein
MDRKSKRLAGEEAAAPPCASVAKPNTALHSLLASDSSQGRAAYDRDLSCKWRLDGSAPRKMSPVTTTDDSESDDSNFDPGALLEGEEDESDDETEEGEEDEEEDEVSEKLPADPDAGLKLINFLELKGMVQIACRCRHCDSPVTLEQETFGLATNLYLTCIPADKRFGAHTYNLRGDEVIPSASAAAATGPGQNRYDTSGNYVINSLLVLVTQQLGLGMKSVSTFLGGLGIRASVGKISTWKKIQD